MLGAEPPRPKPKPPAAGQVLQKQKTRKPALNLGFQFVAQRYDDNPEVASKAGPAFLPPKPPTGR